MEYNDRYFNLNNELPDDNHYAQDTDIDFTEIEICVSVQSSDLVNQVIL